MEDVHENIPRTTKLRSFGGRSSNRSKPTQPTASPQCREEVEGDPIEGLIATAASAEQLLTPADVANLLGVAVRTLERWRMTGEGPAYLQLSRKTIRYRESALATFVGSREKRNTAQ